MRGPSLATAAVIAILSAAPVALAQQQNQGGGWSGTLDQLNRAVNPNSYEEERSRDSRSEGSSGDSSARASGSSSRRDSQFERYSDRELQNRYDRVNDEQRRLQRERRDLEDELSRRGIDR